MTTSFLPDRVESGWKVDGRTFNSISALVLTSYEILDKQPTLTSKYISIQQKNLLDLPPPTLMVLHLQVEPKVYKDKMFVYF